MPSKAPPAKAAKTEKAAKPDAAAAGSDTSHADTLSASMQGTRLTLQLLGDEPSVLQLDLAEFPVAEFALRGRNRTELIFAGVDEGLPIAIFPNSDSAAKALAAIHAALTTGSGKTASKKGCSLQCFLAGVAKWLLRLIAFILVLVLAFWAWHKIQPTEMTSIPAASEQSDLDVPTTAPPSATVPNGVPVSADDALQ
jgi:hypothetical protein